MTKPSKLSLQIYIISNFAVDLLTPILIVIGVVLNILTIAVFSRPRMRKYCLSVSMICLAISDMTILLGPVLVHWIDEYFYNLKLVETTIWCQLHSYVDLVLFANSSWIIVIISIERWFAVYRPYKKEFLFTNRRIIKAIALFFVCSLFLFIYLPIQLDLVTRNVRVLDNNQTFQITKCEFKRNWKYAELVYVIFGALSISFVYIIPSILLFIVSGQIIMRMHSINKKKTMNTHKRGSFFSSSLQNNSNFISLFNKFNS
jgi:hypothetical protein